MKIHPDHKQKYIEVRDELRRLKSEMGLDKMKAELLEFSIFKSLPQVCTECGSTINLTLDHIIPKMFLNDIGIDTEHDIVGDNYQILCKYCNTKKGCRLDIRKPGVKDLLKKIINSL